MPLFTALDQLKQELDALRPLAPEQEARVLQKFRLEWNYNSNAIEGNSLTLGETRALLLHGLTAAGKPIRDHLDIKGHNEAVQGLEDIVRDGRPLTEHFIRETHQLLLGEPYEAPAQTPDGQPTRKRIHPGRYKSSPNNVLTATGEMFYFASPEETPAKMTDLVDWYRREVEQPTSHPVALAAEFHYRFVRIHPFDDGNGRMSRLLMNLILLRAGYLMTVIKATDRNRYLAALAEADAGEFEPFLRFVIENVEASLQLMIRAAKGESIEEPDDLDKKLALLKRQIMNDGEWHKATWELKTQAFFYENTFGFWLSDLHQQLLRFDNFFEDKNFIFEAHNEDHHSMAFSQEVLPFTRQAFLAKQAFVESDRTVHTAFLKTEWNRFRAATHSFDMGTHLQFTFGRHHYRVVFSVYERHKHGYSSSPELLFESTYLSGIAHDRIQELNYTVANRVYEFIKNKLSAIGTTTAQTSDKQ